MWLIICELVVISTVVLKTVRGENMPSSELLALHDLYNSTKGQDWRWRGDTDAYGIPWNFSGNPNPCTDRWQGVTCLQGANPTPQYFVYEISLDDRNLRGTLPSTLHWLHMLNSFSVAVNLIGGTIPVQFGNISKLRHLDLFCNRLTGTIPQSLALLSGLVFANFGNNTLGGTIPVSFANLSALTFLALHYNELRGTIPAGLSSCRNLQYISLGKNYLSGTIPESFGDFNNATQLLLFDNRLSGTIPASLGKLRTLHALNLGVNLLSGTVPASLSNLTNLRQLYFDGNAIDGTIPAELSRLIELRYLYMDGNALYGTISNSVGAFKHMVEFLAYDNMLSGTIPDSCANWTTLRYINVGYNGFTGTIGEYFGGMLNLQYLHMFDNFLTGTIPASLGSPTRLAEVLLYGNKLHGPLPSTLSKLSGLTTLMVEFNSLTGSLSGAFNASAQTKLAFVKVNNNQFTGELDSQLLQLPRLALLVAGSNCLEGSIPEELCQRVRLETLSLDGLSSAATCRNALLPWLGSAYLISNTFHGTLPACLLSLPRISTLHLSSINLAGSLPDTELSSSLIDLAVSHNLLTGTIPTAYQEKRWYSLDLSYNRFTGRLTDKFATEEFEITDDEAGKFRINSSTADTDMNLSLENNRLSGAIPVAIQRLQTVSVLGSNLFSCDAFGRQLPAHDPGRHKYQCGSTQFDIPYYIWVAIVGAVVCLCCALWRWRDLCDRYISVAQLLGTFVAWYGIMDHQLGGSGADGVGKDRGQSLLNTNLAFKVMCRAAVLCTVYAICIMLPLFVVLSVYYGTLSQQYTYVTSAAFLAGTVPAVMELLCYIVLLVVFLAYGLVRLPSSSSPVAMATGHLNGTTSGAVAETQNPIRSNDLQDATTPATLCVTNDQEQNINITNAEVTRSLSSQRWRYFALCVVFTSINLAVVLGANVAYVYTVIYKSALVAQIAQVLVALFKMAWGTIGNEWLVRWTIAQFVTGDKNRSWRAVGSVNQAHFTLLQSFVALLNNIAIPCVVVAVVSPSCFDGIFRSAPKITTPYYYTICNNIFADTCVWYEVFKAHTSYEPAFQYSYQCSSSVITYYAPVFVAMCIFRTFLVPLSQLTTKLVYDRSPPGSWVRRVAHYVLPTVLKDFHPSRIERYGPQKPYFHFSRLAIMMITYIGILLTFGVVFPLLAVCLTVTLLATTIFAKLKVGRALFLATQAGQSQFLDLMEVECLRTDVPFVLRRSLWMVCAFGCAFCTLFVFDAVGDKVGFWGALWMLVAVPLLPLALYLASRVAVCAHRGRCHSARKAQRNPDVVGDVELNASIPE